ncbi:hypothetical protein Pcac1_g15544 [Phytophthora cactorum]|nr:hypothetical protein Pcac1_g15544 [Phytophthora cactorum]
MPNQPRQYPQFSAVDEGPQHLSYEPLLITCIEGFLETEHPFVFLARATFRELLKLEDAREKTLPILAQATRLLSDLVEGEMNLYLSKLTQQIHRKLLTKQLRVQVEDTLAVLESNGGKEALAIIRSKIPTFLIVVLSVFDAAINHSCCNDTAPNGCTDCFTPGIPFWSRTQLVFKRVLRLSVIYAVCLLSVSVFALDVVTIRSYHRRYELNWSSDSEEFVVTKKQETRTATNVLVVVLATQGVVAIVTTVWFDLARWTPLGFAAQWKGMKSRDQGQPTVNISRRPVNYLVMDSDDFFDSDENEDLSSFFDSNNRMIRGTQRPQSPAILSEDRRHLGPSNCRLVVFGLGLAAISFVMTPLLVLLITSYCPPAVASIALNSNLNEPIRTITTLSFVPN